MSEQTRDVASEIAEVPPVQQQIEMVKWHIERFDGLRKSAADRASVVLNAGAILSAGNAVMLSVLFANPRLVSGPLVLGYSAGVAVSIFFIVMAMMLANGVLVSLRVTRHLLRADQLPLGLLFNATDTAARFKTFPEFQMHIASESYLQILHNAEVELWVGMRTYRYRYARLRSAIRALRVAAMIFLVLLIAFIVPLALNS
jgi:hypothetical protein